MEDRSELLMLDGVVAGCAECGVEQLFVPVQAGDPGEHCCTSCDAAVFLLSVPVQPRARPERGVA